jgi:lipopolysaccharide export LptBFGC system permease protein LptF
MRTLIIIALSALFVACASTPDSQQEDSAQTEAEKYVPETHYTESEEAAYKEKFRNSDDDILYYFVIDSDGTVANSVLIDWKKNKYTEKFATDFIQVTKSMKFEEAVPGTPRFREGFFPINVCSLIPHPQYCRGENANE